MTKNLLFPAPNRSVRGLPCSDAGLHWCRETSQTSQGTLRDLGYDVWTAPTGQDLTLIQLCPQVDLKTVPFVNLGAMTHFLISHRHSIYMSLVVDSNFKVIEMFDMWWGAPLAVNSFREFSLAFVAYVLQKIQHPIQLMLSSLEVDWHWGYCAWNSIFVAGGC